MTSRLTNPTSTLELPKILKEYLLISFQLNKLDIEIKAKSRTHTINAIFQNLKKYSKKKLNLNETELIQLQETIDGIKNHINALLINTCFNIKSDPNSKVKIY